MAQGRPKSEDPQDDSTAYLLPPGTGGTPSPPTVAKTPSPSDVFDTDASGQGQLHSGGLFEPLDSDTAGWDSAPGLPHKIAPGQILFDRYLVEQKLGQGGMGDVWLVRHRDLDDLRALKMIVSAIEADTQIRERFKREARIMARFKHPNAVAVHDARFTRDIAFIEMEYIKGRSINTLLKPGVPMPLDWVARIVEQLCDVLQAAHDAGIVHRDLKPTNLMLVEGRGPGNEILKVLDFGIAKLLSSDEQPENDSFKTNPGQFIGTPQYSSPEQFGNGVVDSRSDIYSVGVMLYEFLTGYRPFSGPRVLMDHQITPPPPFRVRNPNIQVPAEIEAVVMRALEKEPEKRQQSARELAEEFRRALPTNLHTHVVTEEIVTQVTPFPPAGTSPSALQSTQRATDSVPGFHGSAVATPIATPPQPSTLRSAETAQPPVAGAYGLVGVPTGDRTQLVEPPKKRLAVPAMLVGLSTVGLAVAAVVLPRGSGGGGSANNPEVATDAQLKEFPGYDRYAPVADGGVVDGWPRLIVPKDAATPNPARLVISERTLRDGRRLYFPEKFEPEPRPGEPSSAFPAVLVRNDEGSLPAAQRMRLILIEGGEFVRGDPRRLSSENRGDENYSHDPPHSVAVTSFYLQETEVTNGQMLAYFLDRKKGEAERPEGWRTAYTELLSKFTKEVADQHPAVGINYVIAEDFAHWLGGRLPTEAEWEYAARSRGQEREYPTDEEPRDHLIHLDAIGELDGITTLPVKERDRDRTVQGLFGMTGNVAEMCQDFWKRYDPEWANRTSAVPDPVETQRNPQGYRVVRGGSFMSPRSQGRTFSRDRNHQENAAKDDVGFRIVVDPVPRPLVGKTTAESVSGTLH